MSNGQAQDGQDILDEELRQLRKIVEPLRHKAKGDYNKWTLRRASGHPKGTYNYAEANEALRNLPNTVWLYDAQWKCEREYQKVKTAPHYPHGDLVWTGRTRRAI